MIYPETKTNALRILRRAHRAKTFNAGQVTEAAAFLVRAGFPMKQLERSLRRLDPEPRATLLGLVYPGYPQDVPEPSIVSTSQVGGKTLVQGSAAPGSSVELQEGERVLGRARTNPQGLWRMKVGLAEGPHTLQVKSTSGGATASATSDIVV